MLTLTIHATRASLDPLTNIACWFLGSKFFTFPGRYLCTSVNADGEFQLHKVGLTWKKDIPHKRWITAQPDKHARPCRKDIGQWDGYTSQSAIMLKVAFTA